MPLISVADVRQLVTTALDDIELAAIIARDEADLVAKLGEPGDGTTEITEIVEACGAGLFLTRPIVSVTTINGAAPGSGLTILPRQGRIVGGQWAGVVTVVYVPADDRERRRQGLIDLVRLTLERTAMQSENVASEYQYAAPDWQAARAAILRRLMYTSV
jgi:hypothetical protein